MVTNTYDGDYEYDQKSGKDVYTWASGNVYEGDFKNDERHGKGKMVWPDGSEYEGDWVRGIQHGWGIMRFPDRAPLEGIFENNVYKGNPGAKKKTRTPGQVIDLGGQNRNSAANAFFQVAFTSGESLRSKIGGR